MAGSSRDHGHWSIFVQEPCTMSKFNELKVVLAERVPCPEQKQALDAAHARFRRGEGRSYSSAEMVRRVRKITRA